MDVRRAERAPLLAPFEQALEGAGPGRVLVEKKSFGLTPAADEHSIQSIRRAWEIVTALAVAVDVEPRLALQFGKHLSIDAQAEAQARREDEVLTTTTNPPSRRELHGHIKQRQNSRHEHPTCSRHGTPPTLAHPPRIATQTNVI